MVRTYLLLILVTVITLSLPTFAYAGGYDDVPVDHWAYNAVEYLYSKGVMVGDEWGRFNGDEALTRYEFAIALARIMEIVEGIEAKGGTYETKGEEKCIGNDVYGIIEELSAEFDAEIEELRAILVEHEERITTLEGDVEEVKGDVAELGDTVKNKLSNIKLTGDTRLRLEGKYKSDDSQVQRPRFMLRLGIEAPINDEFTFKGRLASGSNASPTSTNQTLEGEFDKKPIWIDRIYIQWEPASLKDWTFYGGKFGPNWEKTVITFDSDINVEGLGQSYRSDDGFIVNLAELVPDEKGFYIVAQVGKEDLLTSGLDAYFTYHYINDDAWQFIERKMKDGDLTGSFQFDRIDSDNYTAIDIIGSYTYDANGLPLVLTGNYVLNLADDATDELSGLRQAAWAKLGIGKAKDLGDTEGWVEYGKLQGNSVLSFLTDAARGSSDNEFFAGGFKYKWMKNIDLALTFIYADRLSKDSNYKLVLLDFLGKF